MNTIFSQLPNDLIMKIIKINTINTHEQEFEDLVNDMVFYEEPDDYSPYLLFDDGEHLADHWDF